MPCHSNCRGGCTGSRNAVGPGACNSCAIGKFLAERNYTATECLEEDMECEVGFYKKWRLDHNYGPMAQKQVKRLIPKSIWCAGFKPLSNPRSSPSSSRTPDPIWRFDTVLHNLLYIIKNLWLTTMVFFIVFQPFIPIWSYIFGWAPLAKPRSLSTPSLLNQVTQSDMILLKCT